MHRIPMTKEGYEKLKNELETLKQITRPKIINEISIARTHGDLKENAEYHAAKEEQFLIETKIKEIENKLLLSEIIEIKKIKNEGKIIFSSTVTLTNNETNKKETYKIVGEDEANLKENKISIQSPIARALIGRYTNETIELITPNGKKQYKIQKVEYI